MSEYCFKIKFIEPFFLNQNKEEISVFHAHLVTDSNILELRIYFDPTELQFEHIFSVWLKGVNLSNIGKFFEVIDIKDSELNGIDFLQSNVVGFTSGSNQYLNTEKYLSIEIDWARFLWKPNAEKLNTAEFYLNENGFNLVSEYYSVLWQNADNNFSFSRMKHVKDSHQIGEITFNPEFNFYSRDSKSEDITTIHKEPKFQFSFSDKQTEEEVLNTFELLSLASSFYYKKTIDFTTARIHLANHTIIVRKKTIDISDKLDKSSLWPVYKVHDIDEFYKKVNMISIKREYLKKLNLIVKKFNHSNIVDVRSSILLRFAILEICKSEKKNSKSSQFNFKENGIILSKKKKSSLLNEARDLIVSKIEESERSEFINKWTTSIDKITVKPMRSPFIEYLESVGFKTKDFDFSTIKGIRDAITHGSTDKYSEDELIKCNAMLYRITIGLILHELDVKNWNEELDMNIL